MYSAFQSHSSGLTPVSKYTTGDHDGDTSFYVGKRTVPTTKRKRKRKLQKSAKKKNR